MENEKISFDRKIKNAFVGFDSWLHDISQDKVQYSAIRLSLVVTAILWILFVIGLAFYPMQEKQVRYNTIQIALDQSLSKPTVDKKINKVVTESVSAPKSLVVEEKKDVPKKVVPKASESSKAKAAPALPKSGAAQVSAPKAQSQTSSATSAQSTAGYSKANITYKKSVEDSYNNQLSSSKNAQWNDQAFDSSKENVSESTTQNPASQIRDALSGNAGTKDASQSGTKTSSVVNKIVDKSVSQDTSNKLDEVMKAEEYRQGGSTGSTVSIVSIKFIKDNATGKTVISVGGTARTLIKPSSPEILIDDELGKLIDSSRQVTIYFTVLAGGNVPKNSVRFEPESVLRLEIRDEIAEQIGEWRFSQASFDGQGSFRYSIIKK